LIANNGQFLAEAACHDLGLIFIPVFHTAASLRTGRLVRVLPDWRLSLTVAAVFPNARHVPVKVRVFIDFLAAHFQKAPWADIS
jgi:DNA-binding transcriptional LysR family regulator